MNIASLKREILESLKDREYRNAFKEENVFTSICFQIRALREQRDKSQKEIGRMVIPMMAPERISILEDPNADTKPTVATLLRLADAYDVGLDIRFVPFATVIDRSVHTDMKELEVQSFEDELPTLERDIELELSQPLQAHKPPVRVGPERPATKTLPFALAASHSAPNDTNTPAGIQLPDLMRPPRAETLKITRLSQMQGQTLGRQHAYGQREEIA